jgi:Fe-S-cluster containining protein
MILTIQDQTMFAKYYGEQNLIDNDAFWVDVQKVYKDTDIVLPLVVNYKTIRIYQDYMKCNPGECGGCCNRDWYTSVSKHDYDRIKRNSPEILKILDEHLVRSEDESITDEEKKKIGKMSIKGPCPFLKDNVCSIYEIRPDTCKFFPMQLEKHMISDIDGEKMDMMSVRIQCVQSVNAARSVFRELLDKSEDKLLLLPNLNLVNRVKTSEV